ncbi:MAG: hypothetical protein RLZZ528_1759 [Pseudomonadota bacterium]|jgi:DNA-nicking Smr family endonuclease
MSRRPRGLRPEERELWARVARSAQALHPEVQRPVETSDKPRPKKAPAASVPPFRLGSAADAPSTTFDLVPGPAERLAAHPVRMDHGAHRKMVRGRLNPEARIDLHGMTLAEAHPELIRFILNAQDRGLRLVLVITGKGKPRDEHGPIPVRTGVLRHQVPAWLHQMPLGPVVQQVAPAHYRHGGEGAYYVYLRRSG